MDREVELKLDIDPAQVSRLLQLPAFNEGIDRRNYVTVYFDTPKRKLRRNGWVLRVRQSGDRFVQTIKRSEASAGLFDRDEWEAEVQTLTPEHAAIDKTPLGELVKSRQVPNLVPACRSDVVRASRELNTNGTTIELTYDEGSIEAQERHLSINEVELELKAGDVAELMAFARGLVSRAPLKLGVMSKSERGFALADGKLESAAKAPPVALSDKMNVTDGFTAIVTACLKHLRMNEPLLLTKQDPEALHQLRVAVRRLRSAFWLFRPAIRNGEYAAFNKGLRAFTRELGAARNIDAILSTISPSDPARGALESNRRRLCARILRKLESRTFRLFVFDLLTWVHIGKWRDKKKAGGLLMPFSVKRLNRLWGNIEQRAEDIHRLPDEERHKLRIDMKKMRYALEFLSVPLGKDAADQVKFTAAAEGVQDRLGQLNDMATRQAMLAKRDSTWGKDWARHMRAAKRYLRKMQEIGPFWRRVSN